MGLVMSPPMMAQLLANNITKGPSVPWMPAIATNDFSALRAEPYTGPVWLNRASGFFPPPPRCLPSSIWEHLPITGK